MIILSNGCNFVVAMSAIGTSQYPQGLKRADESNCICVCDKVPGTAGLHVQFEEMLYFGQRFPSPHFLSTVPEEDFVLWKLAPFEGESHAGPGPLSLASQARRGASLSAVPRASLAEPAHCQGCDLLSLSPLQVGR